MKPKVNKTTMQQRGVTLRSGAVACLETVKTEETCSKCHRTMQVGETYWQIVDRHGFKSICVLCFPSIEVG